MRSPQGRLFLVTAFGGLVVVLVLYVGQVERTGTLLDGKVEPAKVSSPDTSIAQNARDGSGYRQGNFSAERFGQHASAQDVSVQAVPDRVDFKPSLCMTRARELRPLLTVVSNGIMKANEILASKDYSVRTFHGTPVLVSEDVSERVRWRIFPYRTNGLVSGVQFSVYADDAMKGKILSQSFLMNLDPLTGSLSTFFWDDKHEVLVITTNGMHSYAKEIADGRSALEMVWDVRGGLVSSNIYDWSRRGRPIGSGEWAPSGRRLGPSEGR